MKLYTTKEIAEILQIDEQTARRYVSEGTIKGYKIGKSWRVYETDLKAYIERKPNRKE